MIAIALVYAFVAAGLVVLMGIGATSRVDFALGVVTMVFIIVTWDLVESRFHRRE